jgi:hypothetical protein
VVRFAPATEPLAGFLKIQVIAQAHKGDDVSPLGIAAKAVEAASD